MSGRIIHGGRTGKGHRRRGAVIASWSCFPRIYGPEVRVCFLVKQLKPAKVGQHAYFESGTPNSRADGTQVIVGEGGSAGRLGTQPRFFHSCVFAICAALGESVCALSVMCRLFSRVTAGAVTATMAVAIYCSFPSRYVREGCLPVRNSVCSIDPDRSGQIFFGPVHPEIAGS